mmetsp:Transcript_45280/g.117592  ORF Transcript_45280/g.117592 Transcript_45280/m.117592 type:complete len:276 (+) Transcript_45280:99-926(+)
MASIETPVALSYWRSAHVQMLNMWLVCVKPCLDSPARASRNDVLGAADTLLRALLWRDLDLRVDAQARLHRLHANVVAAAKASRALRHAVARSRPLVLLVQAHGPLDDQELLVSCNHGAIQSLQTIAAVTAAENICVPPGVPENRLIFDIPLLLAHTTPWHEGRVEADALRRAIHGWALALRRLVHLKVEASAETVVVHQRRRVAGRLLGQVLDVGAAQGVLPVSPATASAANVDEPLVLLDQVGALQVRGGVHKACHPWRVRVETSAAWMRARE